MATAMRNVTTSNWINARVDNAVARRFEAIAWKLVERPGDYAYGGARTMPRFLGGRLRQLLLGDLLTIAAADMPSRIMAGQFDREIENAWHDGASAEHWYRYGKRYERDDRE
jgi:hypothetical protein